MQMDTVLNVVALIGPFVTLYLVARLATHGLNALERRRHLAALARKSFHPRMLKTPEQHAAVGASGLRPDEWHAKLASEAIKGRRKKGPSWLDYLTEFQPEKLRPSLRKRFAQR